MAKGSAPSLLSTVTCYLSLRACSWKYLEMLEKFNLMEPEPSDAGGTQCCCHNYSSSPLPQQECNLSLQHGVSFATMWFQYVSVLDTNPRDAKAIFKGGINPHYYCLPILKTEQDRLKLLQCAVENSKFFLGTDSAPHTVGKKECSCGCAGCFTAHMSIELVAEAFEPLSPGRLEQHV